MALSAMMKTDKEKKNTLPTVTVTGVRKKVMKVPVKGNKTFAVTYRNGETVPMDEESMKKVMYNKQ